MKVVKTQVEEKWTTFYAFLFVNRSLNAIFEILRKKKNERRSSLVAQSVCKSGESIHFRFP